LRWQAQFALLTSVWGASFLFIKVADRDLAPVDVALARVALGAAVLVVVLAVGRARLPHGLSVWGHLALVGLIGNAIPFTLFAYGETRISSVLAGLWNATTPLLVLLVATFMLPAERPTGRRVGGLVVGFAGVVVVLGPWRGLGGSELLGQLMCLGAATCYGVAFPYTRRFLAGRPDSGTALSAGQLLWAAAQLALLTVFVGGAPRGLGLDAAGSLLALGALGTGLAYILNYAIVRAAGATTAATVTYLVPVVSTALGVIVLGEGITWNEPLGAAVALGAVAWQGLLRGSRGSARAPTA
jgi:drug/metabolite transporter (DMT)-like permease